MGVPGALGMEKCFARKTGLQYHVDLHLEVDPDMTVCESHEIATQVRNRIEAELDWVADVLVHVEPHGRRYNLQQDAWKIVKSRGSWPRPRT